MDRNDIGMRVFWSKGITYPEAYNQHLTAIVLVQLSGKRAEVGIPRVFVNESRWALLVWAGGRHWTVTEVGSLN